MVIRAAIVFLDVVGLALLVLAGWLVHPALGAAVGGAEALIVAAVLTSASVPPSNTD